MSRDGRHRPPRPCIEIRTPSASPEEAAAIAAAVEEFLRETAPSPSSAAPAGAWLRAGLLERTGLGPAGPRAWGDAEPWGR